jgi:hypothetical protein
LALSQLPSCWMVYGWRKGVCKALPLAPVTRTATAVDEICLDSLLSRRAVIFLLPRLNSLHCGAGRPF